MKKIFSKTLNKCLAVLIALVIAENEHAPDDYRALTVSIRHLQRMVSL